jgi:hypothetical protein
MLEFGAFDRGFALPARPLDAIFRPRADVAQLVEQRFRKP